MAESWRVGFDLDGTPTPLVVGGVYRWSRNPIYLGMGTSSVGFFLVMPNAVTLTLAGLTTVLLQTRVLVEERYLTGVHGESYAEYCRRTSRWLNLSRPGTLPDQREKR
jgi:protein-S-isoprenylcysteine O-methyltransferase Ste14